MLFVAAGRTDLEEGDYESDTARYEDYDDGQDIPFQGCKNSAACGDAGHAEYNCQHGGYHDDWLAGGHLHRCGGTGQQGVFCNDAAGVWHRQRFRILAAQFWGNNDVKNIRKVLGLALLLAIGAALAFFIPAVACPKHVMRIFTTGGDTIRIGASYLSLVALSYPFIAVSNTLRCDAEGGRKSKSSVVISSCTILINIFSIICLFSANSGRRPWAW